MLKKSLDSFQDAQETVTDFIAQRPSWKPFHSPKNLAISLALESSEVLEHFQWCTTEESYRPTPATKEKIKEEIGDVLFLLMALCKGLEIDPGVALQEKLLLTAQKYPVSQEYCLKGFEDSLEKKEEV